MGGSGTLRAAHPHASTLPTSGALRWSADAHSCCCPGSHEITAGTLDVVHVPSISTLGPTNPNPLTLTIALYISVSLPCAFWLCSCRSHLCWHWGVLRMQWKNKSWRVRMNPCLFLWRIHRLTMWRHVCKHLNACVSGSAWEKVYGSAQEDVSVEEE